MISSNGKQSRKVSFVVETTRGMSPLLCHIEHVVKDKSYCGLVLEHHTTYACVFYHFHRLCHCGCRCLSLTVSMSMRCLMQCGVSLCVLLSLDALDVLGLVLICLRQTFVPRQAHVSQPNQAAIRVAPSHKFIPLLGESTALKNYFLRLSLLFSIFQSKHDTHGTGIRKQLNRAHS